MAEEPNAEPKPKEPETFSREYVTELRNENKTYRLKAAEQEKAAKEAAEAVEKAKKDAEKLIGEAKLSANERLKFSELKAVAIKAGIVDLDGLKLADLSKVKLNDETGEIDGADALIEQLKKDKPYLFGSKDTTSSTHKKPSAEEPKPFDASTAKREDVDRELKKLTKQR